MSSLAYNFRRLFLLTTKPTYFQFEKETIETFFVKWVRMGNNIHAYESSQTLNQSSLFARDEAYSPLMARMLTYHGSTSTEYAWVNEKKHMYPDENFAREIMQLFSVGLIQLNTNGTPLLDHHGESKPVYSNDDIMEYARAWTGFGKYKKEKVYSSVTILFSSVTLKTCANYFFRMSTL